jgi:2-C-methyl-D-erythritol 4-phosphate cytidylyltransferase/2-C-methyl-D-erythritol 2,4-cyclodiphosphate synthase
MKTALLLVAAGRGTRAGGGTPKQYRRIGGAPVARRALDALTATAHFDEVVVVISPDDRDMAKAAFGPDAALEFVHGGETRQASVLNGLSALAGRGIDRVVIHDAARPFPPAADVQALLASPPGTSATLAAPLADSIRRLGADATSSVPVPRDGLHAVLTPQLFPFDALLKAHRAAAKAGRNDFTDDCSLMQHHGSAISLVTGSRDNFKITTPEDFTRAEALLMTRAAPALPDIRVGQGYDIHVFGPGDHVTLCGVAIPHERGLSGHSDADVGLHALTDALLATIGAGDIGTHFPPSDPQWRGAASSIFLRHAAGLVAQKGGVITLADVTIVAEAPKVGPHREAMCKVIAEALAIAPSRVSIKATTNEGIGAMGRKEGICALAAATVVFAPLSSGQSDV